MNFQYHNPTRLVFRAGALSDLGEVVSGHGRRALLVTGGGSVKSNGTFECALDSLKGAGISVVECAGVEPNPRLSTVERGAQTAREEKCDIVVALGGGSTMDAAKVTLSRCCVQFYDIIERSRHQEGVWNGGFKGAGGFFFA